MSMTHNTLSRRAILKTAPFLSIAGVSLSGCGVVNTLNRPSEAPTAVPTAVIEIVAERSLNPDVDGMPKPVLLRIYELRTAVTFERSSFLICWTRMKANWGGLCPARGNTGRPGRASNH